MSSAQQILYNSALGRNRSDSHKQKPWPPAAILNSARVRRMLRWHPRTELAHMKKLYMLVRKWHRSVVYTSMLQNTNEHRQAPQHGWSFNKNQTVSGIICSICRRDRRQSITQSWNGKCIRCARSYRRTAECSLGASFTHRCPSSSIVHILYYF